MPNEQRVLVATAARLGPRTIVFGGQSRALFVSRDGGRKGTWTRINGALEWIPAGETESTHRVLTAEDAMLHTVSVMLRY